MGVSCQLLLLLLLAGSLAARQRSRFREEVFFQGLADGSLLASFQFRSSLDVHSKEEAHHYGIFPRPLGQVIHSFNISEMHLSFSRNSWNLDHWGFPPHSVASGAELYAWFTDPPSAAEHWKGLVHTLAGQFCGSLGGIEEEGSSMPRYSLRPLRLSDSPDALRYASLPHEAVCTENLTPWIKFLPCQTHAGLGSLLVPTRLLKSTYLAMAMHIYRVPLSGSQGETIELLQTLDVVFPPRSYKTSEPAVFEIEELFGSYPTAACPVAETSLLRFSEKSLTLEPPLPNSQAYLPRASAGGAAEGAQDKVLRPKVTVVRSPMGRGLRPSFVSTSREVFGGANSNRGRFLTTITNRHKEETLSASYFDWLPWFLRVYLHTLTLKVNGQDVTQASIRTLQPSALRGKPTVIELFFDLGPNQTAEISFEFEKVFLKLSEHRPDANRGFDISGALFVIEGSVDLVGESEMMPGPRLLHTPPQLISMPTPDFSMPYNVITLTCTVIALFFGSIFNTTTRAFHPVERPEEGADQDEGRGGLARKVRALWPRAEKKKTA